MPAITDDAPLTADAFVTIDSTPSTEHPMTHKQVLKQPPASPESTLPLRPPPSHQPPPLVPSSSFLSMFPGAEPGEYVSRRRARQLIHVRLAYGWLSFRVLLLICICLITFGTYWISDTPAALYTQFQQWFGPDHFTADSNANMYAVYSYPNVILPFVCGILVDKFLGVRWGTMLFVSLSTVGEAIFCVGITAKDLNVALIGRFVIGLGGESLSVMQGIYMIKWYASTLTHTSAYTPPQPRLALQSEHSPFLLTGLCVRA